MGESLDSDLVADLAVEEYRSLKDEIGRRQQARTSLIALYAASFSIGAGFVTAANTSAGQRSVILVALIVMSIVLLQDVIFNTRQIRRIATYLRIRFERWPEGPCWETTWIEYSRGEQPGRLPVMTSSKMQALVFTFFNLAALGLSFAYDGLDPVRFVIIPALVIVALLQSADVWFKWSGTWGIDIDRMLEVQRRHAQEHGS